MPVSSAAMRAGSNRRMERSPRGGVTAYAPSAATSMTTTSRTRPRVVIRCRVRVRVHGAGCLVQGAVDGKPQRLLSHLWSFIMDEPPMIDRNRRGPLQGQELITLAQ